MPELQLNVEVERLGFSAPFRIAGFVLTAQPWCVRRGAWGVG